MLRDLSKDIAVYGIFEVFVGLLSFVSIPIFTRLFVPSDYGILALITSIMAMFSIFLNLGMDNSISRYFFEAKDSKERTVIISTGFWFILIWSALLISVLFFLSRQLSLISFKSPSYICLFQLAWFAAALGMMIIFFKNIVRFYFIPWKFGIISLGEGILVLIFTLLFVLKFKWGLSGYFLGTLLGSFIAVLIGINFIKQDLKLFFSFPVIKKLLSYGLPFIPAGIAYWIFNLSDRFMIARLSTLEQLGLYSVAAKVTFGIALLSRIFGRAWSPRALKLYKSSDSHKEIFGQMLIYVLAVFSYIAICLIVLGPEILKLITTSEYYGALYAIGPLALGLVAYSLNQITMMGINLIYKTKYIAYIAWLVAIINIVLNFLLIPKYGMVGASIATMVSYITLTAIYGFISQKLYPIKIDLAKLFKIIVIVIIFTMFSFGINYISANKGVAVLLFFKITYLLLYPVLFFLTGIFSRKEILYIKAIGQIFK
jgi:O-antigen/teichoic acid export membrane protein